MTQNNIPKHVAIIMDGNGRWAQKRGLPRVVGHRQGINQVREIIKAADELGVKTLTIFAFSAENWQRPKREVDMLMHAFNNFLDRESADLDKNNISFRVIGRGAPLPQQLLEKISETENRTKDNSGLTLVLALNYGSRQEIVDALKKITASVINGETKPEDLNSENFGNYLYTAGLPDPDLLIRTGAEMRISNFLLWQISYAELYFCDKYWPDFGKEDFKKAIQEYQKRERRFGRIDNADKKDS